MSYWHSNPSGGSPRKTNHTTQKCANCGEGSHMFINDSRSGDCVCRSCGAVIDERQIVEDVAEYRQFTMNADETVDNQQARRVGHAISIYQYESLSFSVDKDEQNFILNGQRKMTQFFRAAFSDSFPKHVACRASELYDFACRKQRAEKKAAENLPTASCALRQRQKYSKKTTLIVASIWNALLEANIAKGWSVQKISGFFNKYVSDESVTKCIKDFRNSLDTQSSSLSIRTSAPKYTGSGKKIADGILQANASKVSRVANINKKNAPSSPC